MRSRATLAALVLVGALAGCQTTSKKEDCLKENGITSISMSGFQSEGDWKEVKGLEKQIPTMMYAALNGHVNVEQGSSSSQITGKYTVRKANQIDVDIAGQKLVLGSRIIGISATYKNPSKGVKDITIYREVSEPELSTVVDGLVNDLLENLCNKLSEKQEQENAKNTAALISSILKRHKVAYLPEDSSNIQIWKEDDDNPINNAGTTAKKMAYSQKDQTIIFSDGSGNLYSVLKNGTYESIQLEAEHLYSLFPDLVSLSEAGFRFRSTINNFSVGKDGRMALALSLTRFGVKPEYESKTIEERKGLAAECFAEEKTVDYMCLYNPQANKIRALTNDFDKDSTFDLSPDMKRLAYTSPSKEVRILDLNNPSNWWALTSGMNPRWSPDGSTIAYVSHDQVYSIDSSGGEAERLTNDSGECVNMEWLRTGNGLLYDNRFTSWSINFVSADGTKQAKLKENARMPLPMPK